MRKHLAVLFILSISISGKSQISDSLLSAATERYPMLEECTLPGHSEKVLCGILEVYEDYTSNQGKKIPIEVVVLPSKTKNPDASAFTLHWGGNGSAAKSKVWFIRPGSTADEIRNTRDVVLIDDRGTGASNIRCAAMDSLQPYSYALAYDEDLIRECLEEVRGKENLHLYNTQGVVSDYDQVRHWLGLEQFDFYGISYGVRVGLEYMKTYPDRVRTLTVQGCVPPGFDYVNEMDIAIQEQLEILFQRCENDSICHKHYPNFQQELYETRDRLKQNPVQLEYELENGGSKMITMDDLLFRRIVGHQILNGNANEAVPLLIHRAYEGNYAPLIVAGGSLSLDMPVFLSQFCPEEIDRFEYQENSAALFTQGAIAEEKKKACALWMEMPAADWLDESLEGNSPILILTGENDANTPIRMGEQIRNAFPERSRHFILPFQGHASSDGTCRFDLISQFVASSDLQAIDTSCLNQIKPNAFAFELSLTHADFEKFAGEYDTEDAGKILSLFKLNGIHYLKDEYSQWTGPSQLLYKGNDTFGLLDCPNCQIIFEMEDGKPLKVQRVYRDTTIFKPVNTKR